MNYQSKTYSPRKKNIAEDNKATDPYDVLFNLIFLMHRVKSKAERRKSGNYYEAASKVNLNGLMANVAEIGLQPAIFPYRMMIDNLTKQINDLTEIQLDTTKDPRYGTSNSRLSFGLASIGQLLGNPRMFVKQGVAKYKAERDFAKMGGLISRSIDSAIFTLWAKELGATTKEAISIGKLYGEDLHPDFLKEKKVGLIRNVQVVSASEAAMSVGADKEIVKEAIELSYGIKVKVDRKMAMEKVLEDSGVDVTKRVAIVDRVYGETNSDPKKPEEMGIWVDTEDDRNLYQLQRIGQNAAQAELATRIAQKNPDKQSRNEKGILKKLQELSSNEKLTPGKAVGQFLVDYKFVKEGLVDGEFGKNLLQGKFDKLRICEKKEYSVYFGSEPVLDKDGRHKRVSIVEGKDGIMGKLLGPTYYLHPVNLFNGLFVNGDLWLKMAKKRGPHGVYINAKSPAYFIYNLMPRQLLTPIKMRIQKIFSQILGKIITTSMKTAFKTAIKSVLSFVLGGIPGAGLVIQLLFDKIIDEAAELAIQILVFVCLALAAYVIITVDGLTTYIDQLKPDQAIVVTINSSE